MIQMINFIDTTNLEKELILKWRNNPIIRLFMHNNIEISFKEHLDFIESLKDKNDKKYFLIKINDKYIGVIDYINISRNDTKFGIYTNPQLKGFGQKIMNTLCQYAFDELKVLRLIAEVNDKNKNAIKLYQKFNFQEFKRHKNGQKEIIYMELINKNWKCEVF